MTLATHEARRIRRYFTNALWKKLCAEFYWLPESRRVLSLERGASRTDSLPRAAILIGIYRHPCDAALFLEDLNDKIDQLARR